MDIVVVKNYLGINFRIDGLVFSTPLFDLKFAQSTYLFHLYSNKTKENQFSQCRLRD